MDGLGRGERPVTMELLAPAGSPECLRTALYFGADAVYVGLERFGLRAFAENFTPEQLRDGVRLAHSQGRRVYVALNALLGPEDLPALRDVLADLAEIGPDAVIFADPAVLMTARSARLDMPLHLSTQASTMNEESCRFWMENGVKRIILARELSLEQIAVLRRGVPDGLQLEVFVHGAMCVAYSGRCLLSTALTGRSGNDGRCAQPCRWSYEISEVGGDGRRFPLTENQQGTFVLNSKDLMMIDHLAELRLAGVDSLKIEGRNKSAYYVASVVSAYRRALDAMEQGVPADLEALRSELLASSSRQTGTGFFFGRKQQQDPKRTELPRQYTFVGRVVENPGSGYVTVEQRNKFVRGDRLEVLSPNLQGASFEVGEICTLDGGMRSEAPHPQELLRLACPLPLSAGDLLRRRDS